MKVSFWERLLSSILLYGNEMSVLCFGNQLRDRNRLVTGPELDYKWMSLWKNVPPKREKAYTAIKLRWYLDLG